MVQVVLGTAKERQRVEEASDCIMRQGIEHSVYVGNLKRIWGLVRALEA